MKKLSEAEFLALEWTVKDIDWTNETENSDDYQISETGVTDFFGYGFLAKELYDEAGLIITTKVG
jgi:hypothetical protein